MVGWWIFGPHPKATTSDAIQPAKISDNSAEATIPPPAPPAPVEQKRPEIKMVSDKPMFGTMDLGGWSDPGFGALTEKVVRAALRDPDSAIFTDMFLVGDRKYKKSYPLTVCGYVNAKNGFGGYAGKQNFVYIPITEQLLIGNSAAALWNRMCAGKHIG